MLQKIHVKHTLQCWKKCYQWNAHCRYLPLTNQINNTVIQIYNIDFCCAKKTLVTLQPKQYDTHTHTHIVAIPLSSILLWHFWRWLLHARYLSGCCWAYRATCFGPPANLAFGVELGSNSNSKRFIYLFACLFLCLCLAVL